jgi:hypothetical protein
VGEPLGSGGVVLGSLHEEMESKGKNLIPNHILYLNVKNAAMSMAPAPEPVPLDGLGGGGQF